MLAMCQERKKQKSSLMLTRKERIAACVAELQKLEQQQERYRQEKFRAYEDYSGGTLAKDAYLRQRADIDGKLAAAARRTENAAAAAQSAVTVGTAETGIHRNLLYLYAREHPGHIFRIVSIKIIHIIL